TSSAPCGSNGSGAAERGVIISKRARHTGRPAWSEMLHGFSIGITADRRWEEQAALFERRGAAVVHGPAIRTQPLGSDARLQAATASLIARPPDVVIANTGLGIRSWLGAAESWGRGADL